MATYYVSPSGSDSAAGSTGSPWKTLGRALAAASNGDTVRCERARTTSSQMDTPNVTFEADAGHTPTIDGRYHPGLFGAAVQRQKRRVVEFQRATFTSTAAREPGRPTHGWAAGWSPRRHGHRPATGGFGVKVRGSSSATSPVASASSRPGPSWKTASATSLMAGPSPLRGTRL